MVKLDEIQEITLASELPAVFVGTVTKVEEGTTKEEGKSLNFFIEIAEPEEHKGETTQIMYRLAKSLTGKGQTDILKKYMNLMGDMDTDHYVGKKLKWERHSLKEQGVKLPADFKEQPRHYPVAIIEPS